MAAKRRSKGASAERARVKPGPDVQPLFCPNCSESLSALDFYCPACGTVLSTREEE